MYTHPSFVAMDTVVVVGTLSTVGLMGAEMIFA